MRALRLPLGMCSVALISLALAGEVRGAISSLPLVLVETQELTGSAAETVTFSSIAAKVPAGTEHLLLEVSASSTDTMARMANVRINNDSGNNYKRNYLSVRDTAFSKLASTTSSGWVADIPPSSSGGRSSATVLFPWAFGDHYKTMLGQTSSHGERFTHSKAHWLNTAPISSISLSAYAGVQFEPGSIFRLWAVDERYRITEQTLATDGDLGVSVPHVGEHLVVMMHARSDELATDGAQIHHILNGDASNVNYHSVRVSAEVPAIQDQQVNTARIAYIPSDNQEAGHFGESVTIYPWYRDPTRDRTHITQHANDDSVWLPSQVENGRWNNAAPMTSIAYRQQVGGEAFTAESELALYRTRPPVERVVLGQDQASVTLQVPSAFVGSAQVLINARSDLAAAYDGITMSINGDDNDANYLRQSMGATDGTHDGSRENSRVFGVVPGAAAADGVFAGGMLTLFEASRGDRQKEFLYFGGAAEERIELSGGAWLENNPITSITFRVANGGNFKANSTFEIWTQQDLGTPGDFNGDNLVDAADYTVWRNNFGDLTENDINNSGNGRNGVDEADYAVWKLRYGETYVGGAGVGNLEVARVPEPAGIWIAAVALAAFDRWRITLLRRMQKDGISSDFAENRLPPAP